MAAKCAPLVKREWHLLRRGGRKLLTIVLCRPFPSLLADEHGCVIGQFSTMRERNESEQKKCGKKQGKNSKQTNKQTKGHARFCVCVLVVVVAVMDVLCCHSSFGSNSSAIHPPECSNFCRHLQQIHFPLRFFDFYRTKCIPLPC